MDKESAKKAKLDEKRYHSINQNRSITGLNVTVFPNRDRLLSRFIHAMALSGHIDGLATQKEVFDTMAQEDSFDCTAGLSFPELVKLAVEKRLIQKPENANDENEPLFLMCVDGDEDSDE